MPSPRSASRTGTTLAAVAVLLLTTVSGPTPRAGADQFTPPADPPVVTSISIGSDEGGTFTGLTPASPTSTTVYTVSAQLTVPATLVGIKHVQLCLWLVSAEDCDADYSATEPDPQTLLLANWSWDTSQDQSANTDDYATWTEQFQLVGDNNHAIVEDGSQTVHTDATVDTTMDIDFSFTVSRAMRHSNDWTARVRVVDETDQQGERSLENLLVNYFGAVTTNRTPLDFGALDEVGRPTSTIEDQPLGQYVANSQSDITIEATDFTNGADTLVLDPSVDDAANRNQGRNTGALVMRCSPGATFDMASAQILDAGAEFFGPTVSIISAEAPEDIGTHSCRLQVPFGQVSRPNVTYVNQITVAIGADELTAPGNLTASSGSDGTLVTLAWDQPVAVNESGVELSSYVVERSTDSGTTYTTIGTIDTGFTNQMSFTDTGLSPSTQYQYRVTANITDVGAGSSVASVLTNSSGQTFNLLLDLNEALSGFRATTSASSVVSAMQGVGVEVFASPRLGAMAELLTGTSGAINQTGRFSTTVMGRRTANHYLAESEGFSTGALNGHPFIGFVAMTNSEYLGSGVMLYRDYDSTTHLRELFSPTAWRYVYGAVLDNGRTTESQLEKYTSSSTRTIFSNSQRAGYYGYYSSSRFSADDGVWGFANGGRVDGNSPGPDLSDYPDGRFGIQNPDSSDTSTSSQKVYWDSRTITGQGGVMYFFVVYS